jgi:endonuclease G
LLVSIGLFLSSSAQAQTDGFARCRVQLPFGEPVAATTDPTMPVCHDGYAALVDDKQRVPLWVAYTIGADHVFGCLKRKDNFHPEAELPAAARSTPSDYSRSGYDKGHMAPAEDFAWNAGELSDSFSMANMSPQIAGLNRQGWERLEEDVRAWAWTRGSLDIYVGPIMRPGETSVPDGRVTVPTGFWKVIVDPAKHQALAFEMPQQAVAKASVGARNEKSIAAIEADAKIRLPLPSSISEAAKPALWPADLTRYRQHRQAVCGGTKS